MKLKFFFFPSGWISVLFYFPFLFQSMGEKGNTHSLNVVDYLINQQRNRELVLCLSDSGKYRTIVEVIKTKKSTRGLSTLLKHPVK